MTRRIQQLIVLAIVMLIVVPEAAAVRIKDVAYIQGVRDNQLLGYGLVVGLQGTGDSGSSEFTVQSTASMLSRMGIKVDRDQIRTRNVAAVMVTADLPPFARSGQKLDVIVSSLGNAKSLQGGTLLMTPLLGPDGQVYAMGQGALSIGGFGAEGPSGGNSAQKNHLTAGRVPNGAIVEREVAVELAGKKEIRLILHTPDFRTAVDISRKVSGFWAEQSGEAVDEKKPDQGIASAVDAATIRVEVPEGFSDHVPQFIATLEMLDVSISTSAKVVVNERTGTVVLGGDVRISEVAVAHGSLNVTVATENEGLPAAPLNPNGADKVANEFVNAQEGAGALQVVQAGASIGDVVGALNALGVTPRDLIAILQAIDSAGALHAKLVIQ